MNFMQIGKRVLLFLAVNVLVMVTISVALSLLRAGGVVPRGGLGGLLVFCLVWGFAGALISLALSRVMARWMMGVQVISPDTSDPELRTLVETVHELAQRARLPELPQVGVYDSPELNAFATGPTRSRSLVAVSSGLLQSMRRQEVQGVLAHEVAHIANGDMVTMALVQGVVNSFSLFLSRVLAFVISQALRSRDDDRGGGLLQYVLIVVFDILFTILGSIVVCGFSRFREFRADAGGARFAGRETMIGALRALERQYDPQLATEAAHHEKAFQTLKISGAPRGWLGLFATHPPLEERIARLEQMRE